MGCNFKKCISFWSQQWYGNGRRKNHLNINMSLIQIFPFYSLLSSQDTFVRSIIRRYVWKVFPFSSRLAAGRRGAGTSKTHFFLPLINFIFRRHSLPSTLTPRGCIKPKYNNKRCRFPSRRNISPQIYCAIKMLLRLMINYMYNKQNLHKLNVFHLCIPCWRKGIENKYGSICWCLKRISFHSSSGDNIIKGDLLMRWFWYSLSFPLQFLQFSYSNST